MRRGPAARRWSRRSSARASAAGLLLYPGSGTVDGVAGNHVLFAPPFIATAADISEMVGRFGEVVDACL